MKRSLLVDCLRIGRRLLPGHPEWTAYKHYSFIIQDNKIVEWATNRAAPPLIGYSDWQKLHAENVAYFRARGLLERNKPFSVINIRFNKRGDIRLSRPCKCCTAFLKFLGCTEVWFTTEVEFARLLLI